MAGIAEGGARRRHVHREAEIRVCDLAMDDGRRGAVERNNADSLIDVDTLIIDPGKHNDGVTGAGAIDRSLDRLSRVDKKSSHEGSPAKVSRALTREEAALPYRWL